MTKIAIFVSIAVLASGGWRPACRDAGLMALLHQQFAFGDRIYVACGLEGSGWPSAGAAFLTRADPTILRGWLGKETDPRRRQTAIDGWLTTVARGDKPLVSQAILDVAQSASHPSPIGYLRLGRMLADDTNRSSEGARALQLAIDAPAEGYAPVAARAEAGFRLGELQRLKGNRDAALAGYRAAMNADPRDISGGYAWMSAMQAADILVARGSTGEALDLLSYAGTLPDLYKRRALAAARAGEIRSTLQKEEGR